MKKLIAILLILTSSFAYSQKTVYVNVPSTTLPYIQARDTVYILASGQSNSAGGAEDAIDTAADARVQGWDDVLQSWVTLRVGFRPMYTLYPSQGGSGYPIGPSAQFFFGRKLAREKDVIVRVVNWGIGGAAIANWHSGTVRGSYLNIIANMTADAKVPKYDYFIWGQGEANSNSTSSYYTTAWDSVKASFRRYPWFPATTKIAVVGMPRQWQGAPASDGIDPTLQSFDGNIDPWDGYVNTDDATVNVIAAADGGVRIHFNSKGLKHLGEDMIWGTFASLPTPQRTAPSQTEFLDFATVNNVYLGHGSGSSFKTAGGGYSNNWLSNTVVTPAVGVNGKWAPSSMLYNTTGSYNTVMGREAMQLNLSGFWNSAFGAQALQNNSAGSRNSAFGLQAMFNTSGGNNNTALGYTAGSLLGSGNNNVILGSSTAARLANRDNWMLFANGAGVERFTVDSAGNFGINTIAPTNTLHVVGSVKLDLGNLGAGKVLTSDAFGVATWQTPSGGGGGITTATLSDSLDFFIPRAGTRPGKEVTGNVVLNGGSITTPIVGGISSLYIGVEDGELGVISVRNTFSKKSLLLSNNRLEFYSPDDSIVNVQLHKLEIVDGQLGLSYSGTQPFLGGRGIIASLDYTPNITDLDYTQKKYVDTKADSARNNAGVLEIRKKGIFVPQFTLPAGGSTDTASLSNRINLKVNISDTAAMLQKYKDTIAAHNIRIIGKQGLLTAGTNISIVGNTISASGGGGGTTETASNGLNKFTDDIRLGGSLTQSTLISTNGQDFTVNGTSTNGGLPVFRVSDVGTGASILGINTGGGAALSGYTTTGITANLSSNSGYAVILAANASSNYASDFSAANGVVSRFNRTSSNNNTVNPIIQLEANTASPVSGFGAGIEFKLTAVGAGATYSNRIASKWINPTFGSLTSEFEIEGWDNGTIKPFANFQPGGIIRVNNNLDTLATRAYARSFGGGGVTDHTLLTNIGTNTHAQIDAHLASTSNPHNTTKAQVGLSLVDNTSDLSKPVSTAQQTALNLKANLASPTFTGTVAGITKGMVGLGLVDNTADADKPISTAVAAALGLKSNAASPIFTGVTRINGSLSFNGNEGIAGYIPVSNGVGLNPSWIPIPAVDTSFSVNPNLTSLISKIIKDTVNANQINLKTINGQSLIGVGNITISSGTVGIEDDDYMRIMRAMGSGIITQNPAGYLNDLGNGVALVDNQVHYLPILVKRDTTITGVMYGLQTAGSFTADNNNKIGLYSYSAGTFTLVASTANNSTHWTGAGNSLKKIALTAPFAITKGVYFVAFLYNNSAQTTAPQLYGFDNFNNTTFQTLDFTNNVKFISFANGNDLPASIATSSTFGTSKNYWYALY